MGFLGQMEQVISSGKNGSKYDAVPFVKNNPVEFGRRRRLVPGFAKSSTLGEIFANGTAYPGHFGWNEKRGIPSKAFLLFQKIFTRSNRSI